MERNSSKLYQERADAGYCLMSQELTGECRAVVYCCCRLLECVGVLCLCASSIFNALQSMLACSSGTQYQCYSLLLLL